MDTNCNTTLMGRGAYGRLLRMRHPSLFAASTLRAMSVPKWTAYVGKLEDSILSGIRQAMLKLTRVNLYNVTHETMCKTYRQKTNPLCFLYHFSDAESVETHASGDGGFHLTSFYPTRNRCQRSCLYGGSKHDLSIFPYDPEEVSPTSLRTYQYLQYLMHYFQSQYQ